MIIRAKHDGNVIVFELEGQLDFETTLQFKNACESVIEKNAQQRIVFNMEKLRFVGSSGINQFIRVLKDFNSLTIKPRYCRLSSEFTRVFRAYQTSRNPFEIHEDEQIAITSFDAPPVIAVKKPRKKLKEIES